MLLDPDSRALHESRRPWTHPAAEGGGLGSDLDLAEIWIKLGEASREALARAGAGPNDVAAVAVTSMRNTIVVIDSEGEALFATPNQDARAVAESFEIAASDGRGIYDISGHWPSPLFMGTRLLWLQKNAPEVLDTAAAIMSLSDWTAFKLGAGIFAERSQAGETLLFDVSGGRWSQDLVSLFGLEQALFPEPVDAGRVIGSVDRAASGRFGLAEGVPIVACGADTQCGMLGSGAVEPGDVCVIAGTTMPVQAVTGELALDGEGRLWSGRHVVPGLYYLESNGLVTGSVLEWLAGIIYAGRERPVEAMFTEAELSEPGAFGGYSTFGACTFDARKVGIPVGNLIMSHMVTPGRGEGRRHLSRALLEGIAYSARANIDQLAGVLGAGPARLRACAGMTESVLWTQILADVTDKEVMVASTTEASALGAAICAGVGAGVFESFLQGARAVAGPGRVQSPGPDGEKYRRLYEGWSQACSLRAPADDQASMLMTIALLERPVESARGPASGFKPRTFVTASLDEAALVELGEMGQVDYADWRATSRVYTGGPDLAAAAGGCQVLVTEMDVVDFEAIDLMRDLKVIVSCRVNPVNVDIESATAYGIPVLNTPGRNADAVADLTVAFMVMLARKLPEAAVFLGQGVEAGDMARMGEAYGRFQGRELWRKTVGLIGLGSVGKAVATRLRPFGASVLFYDPVVSAEEGEQAGAAKVDFERLLTESDFVSLHAPALEETRGIVGRDAFAMMKEGSFFINTARASLVDDVALLEALRSGRLAGCALDVFAVEPPGSDDPLVRDPRVITTPHLGGNTFETAAHQGAIAAEQIRKLLAGVVPDHILNPEVLEAFDWMGPRTEPSRAEKDRLAGKPKPTITS